MSIVKITAHGDFSKTFKFLRGIKAFRKMKLEKYAEMGLAALRDATPKDSGLTSESWQYEINVGDTSASIRWINTNENKGYPIVVLIQYGHGTRNGGYVPGRDFINPAMRPVFDKIADDAWMEVISG